MSYPTHYIVVWAESHDDATAEAENHINEFFETYGEVESAVCLLDNPDIEAVCAEVEDFLRVCHENNAKEAMEVVKLLATSECADIGYSEWFALKMFASAGREGVVDERGTFTYKLLDSKGAVNECFAHEVCEGVSVATYGESMGDVRTETKDGCAWWLVKVSLHY